MDKGSEVVWLHRCRFDRESIIPKEYIRWNFHVGPVEVSWYKRKQISVVLNSTEAEYMAASQETCEEIWMRKILVGLFGQMMDPTVIIKFTSSSLRILYFTIDPSI